MYKYKKNLSLLHFTQYHVKINLEIIPREANSMNRIVTTNVFYLKFTLQEMLRKA